LRSFINEYRDAQVLINHGDRCVDFAADLRADGFHASAPKLDERIVV